MFKRSLTVLSLLFATLPCLAIVPKTWVQLTPILISRLEQSDPKMKLSEPQVESFIAYLKNLHAPTPELIKLQARLPKTTLELLRSTQSRGVELAEAEKMAAYLQTLLDKFKFKRPNVFDENTSHIIGREFPEIDYSGENLTWEKQRIKYMAYGVEDFKSLDQLAKFFPVEAKEPYFAKVYLPENPNALGN